MKRFTVTKKDENERKTMGLAASQARLLTITARKADCEFQSMTLSHQKLALSRNMEAVSEEYQKALSATKEECAKAVDMGDFYRVPADNRGLNYDKFFKEGNEKRNTLTEFNSNNTKLLTVEETKAKIAALAYIKEELAKDVK